ncbi:MAG: hypothetical protein GY811_10075 [Myxococcales bacterium]|nr:hypothetical protein [Myxococcales bacterium]
MNDYIWLLPPAHVSSSGDVMSLMDFNNHRCMSFPGPAEDGIALLGAMDGERTEREIVQLQNGADLLRVLEDQELIVRLQRPLSTVLSGRVWASRQLAYYAQLTRQHPDRCLDALSKVRVAIIGLGGIGMQAAQALAGAGVGGVILSDFDTVDASNLNRQFMFAIDDIGRLKVEVAQDFLAARHPHLEIEVHAINPFEQESSQWERADLFLFCGETHLAGDANQLITHKPVIQAGYIGPQGLVGPLRWVERGTPCHSCTVRASEQYADFYANEVELATSWNCSGATVNGLMGNILAEAATRVFTPWLGEVLGRDEIIYVDMKTLEMRRELTQQQVECPHQIPSSA